MSTTVSGSPGSEAPPKGSNATSGAPKPVNRRPPVIDYEGSPYRTEFWEGTNRAYEDATERLALHELVPPRGRRIAEIGAGFGRLADLYDGYEQIILFDYSRTMLADAVAKWGSDPRFVFVAGNIYDLPLAMAAPSASTASSKASTRSTVRVAPGSSATPRSGDAHPPIRRPHLLGCQRAPEEHRGAASAYRHARLLRPAPRCLRGGIARHWEKTGTRPDGAT